MVVRPCTAGDFDAWFDLFAAVAAEGRWLGAQAPVDPVPRRAFFDRCLAGDGAALFLAEAGPARGGPLVGTISVDLHHGIADIGMAVTAARRGTGVGSALLDAALAFAREAGAHKVSLVVWAHNHAARALYAKYGFVTEGTRRRHYRRRSGELWDAVLMGLVLDESSAGGPAARPKPPPALLPPPGGLTEGGLVLRPLGLADAPALTAAVDDPEIRRWLDTIPDPYGPADAEEFLASARRQMAEGRAAALAITEGGRLVGTVELHLHVRNDGAGEVGYWVAASVRGRGVGTAAVSAVARWGFGPLGLRRIELLCAVGNTASRTVAERAGFELEGIRRAWRVVHGRPTDFAAYAAVTSRESSRSA